MNPEPLKNKVWETRAMYKKNNQYSGEEIFTKEDVKSACEFYLRYKDRAKKFISPQVRRPLVFNQRMNYAFYYFPQRYIF